MSDSVCYRGKCAYCLTDVGRKLCSQCKLTRYCSRECQKSAWKAGHKLSCGRASGTDQPGSPALSKWVEEWKGALMSWSCWAMDLTNHPRDRLASHIFFIRIEPRPHPPHRAQSHRMVAGEVLSRDDFRHVLTDLGTPPESMAQWEHDRRGEDTVQVCVYCQGPLPHIMRWLWFTLKDGGAWFRAKAPNISRALAENWEEKLMAIIESGDVKRTEKHPSEVLLGLALRGEI